MVTEVIDVEVRERGAARTARSISSVGTSALKAGGQLAGLTLVLAGVGFVLAAKQAADFETSLLDVAKTTGITGGALDSLGAGFTELTKSIPSTAVELAGIGSIAGQLGIQGSANILTFTETVAKFATVTRFSTEEAATALAQLSNVFQIPITQAENLASAMNEVSNTTTATAPILADFSQRLGVSGRQIGLSAADIVGLSGTMVDLGFQSELAGTALSKVFLQMISDSDKFAVQLGLSTDEFRQNIEEDAIGTIGKWAEALSKLPTDELIEQLDDVGIRGARGRSVILALSSGFDSLSTNVANSNKAFEEATSLQTEFDIQMKSTAKQAQLLRNEIDILIKDFGESLLPIVNQVIQIFKEVAATDEVIEFFNLLKFAADDTATSLEKNASSYVSSMKAIIDIINAVTRFGIKAFSRFNIEIERLTGDIFRVQKLFAVVSLDIDKIQQAFGAGADNDAQVIEGEANVRQLTFAIESSEQALKTAQAEFQGLDEKFKTVAADSKKTEEGVKKVTESVKELGKEAAKVAKEVRVPQVGDLVGVSREDFDKALAEARSSGNAGDLPTGGVNDFFKSQEVTQGIKDQEKELLDATREATDRLAEAEGARDSIQDRLIPKQVKLNEELESFRALADQFPEIITDQHISAFEEYVALQNETIGLSEDFAKGAENAAQAIGTAFEDAILQGGTLQEVLQGLLKDLARIAIRGAVTKPLEAQAGGLFKSLIGGAVSLFGGGGGAAAGGLNLTPQFASQEGFDGIVSGSGGRDSKVFTSMVRPGERIKIETPTQQQNGGGSGQRTTINNNSTTIVTKDQQSFKKSRAQISTERDRKASLGRKFD